MLINKSKKLVCPICMKKWTAKTRREFEEHLQICSKPTTWSHKRSK